MCSCALIWIFLELEILCGDYTIRGRPGRLSHAKPSLPELLEKTSWHLCTALALGSLKAPGAGGLSRDIGGSCVPLPCQKRVKGCLSTWWFREIWREKVCLFFQEIRRHTGEMPLGLCYFSHRKEQCFMLLGHCLWLSKSCPEEKSQCRLWGGSVLRFS